MIIEEQEHLNRLAIETELTPALFDALREPRAVPPHTTPHHASLSAGTFLPDRHGARRQATQREEFSTVDYPTLADAESLKQISHLEQKTHPYHTKSVYREVPKPVETEGSVPVGSAATKSRI